MTKAEDGFAEAGKELEAAKLNVETVKAKQPAAPFDENLDPIAPELELTPRAGASAAG